MADVSNVYFIFITSLFVLLSCSVIYVLFLYPMFEFVSTFVPFNAWCVIIPLAIFVLFVSLFISTLTKQGNDDEEFSEAE